MKQLAGHKLPCAVREISHVWIPTRDSTRLAARIWLPTDANMHPVPAILEYLPYRLSDITALADSRRHPYFAGHGYASVRVDLRGTGNSEGILRDEYLVEEQDDALDVLDWLAQQPWCDGSVGIIGISWGGFNGLQIAARRPPQLKAIISIGASVDRYTDDVHYMGGAVLGSNMLSWSAYMLCINALPPDPQIVGEAWRELWQARLEQTPPYVHAWLSHPTRDAYWKHGSVCEDYAAIGCPIFAVGGWADGYTNSVLHLLEHLQVPRKGLIGPWSHDYAYEAIPGPQIGFLRECVRWWDHWLKGIENGIMQEPMLGVWMQESVPPRTYYDNVKGLWIAEPTFPSVNITPREFFLLAHSLALTPARYETKLTLASPQATGLAAGEWCPHGYPGEMPGDQRADDGKSLCFDSPAFDTPFEILGFPQLTCTVAADKPIAFLIARLCDVAPDGSSLLVSRGVLNLTHHASHESPEPLIPYKFYNITLNLNACAHSLAVGHRWRLALSTTYWHHLFPAPETATVTLLTNSSAYLVLPVYNTPPQAKIIGFSEPATAVPIPSELVREPAYERRIVHDLDSDRIRLTIRTDGGCRRLQETGLEYEWRAEETFSIIEGQPLTAHILSKRMRHIQRADWDVRVETASEMRADAHAFHVTDHVIAYDGETRVFEQEYIFSTPRDLM